MYEFKQNQKRKGKPGKPKRLFSVGVGHLIRWWCHASSHCPSDSFIILLHRLFSVRLGHLISDYWWCLVSWYGIQWCEDQPCLIYHGQDVPYFEKEEKKSKWQAKVFTAEVGVCALCDHLTHYTKSLGSLSPKYEMLPIAVKYNLSFIAKMGYEDPNCRHLILSGIYVFYSFYLIFYFLLYIF